MVRELLPLIELSIRVATDKKYAGFYRVVVIAPATMAVVDFTFPETYSKRIQGEVEAL